MNSLMVVFILMFITSGVTADSGIQFAGLSPVIIRPPTVPQNQWPDKCACYPTQYCRNAVFPGRGIDPRVVTPFCCPGTTNGLEDGRVCGNRSLYDPSLAGIPGFAVPGEYPWIGALLTQDNFYAGGSVLIGSRYALTAAHKVINNQNLKVRVGVTDSQIIDDRTRDYIVNRVVVHPNFDLKTLANDIALVVLTEDLSLNHKVGIACLSQELTITPGTKCWVPGWGKDTFQYGTYQTKLKSVQVPIVDFQVCQNQLRSTQLGPNFNLDTTFLCAGGEINEDACTGDGGSPLLCELSNGLWYAVGLVSWGVECGENRVPGIYTNNLKYLSWLKQYIS